MHNKPISEIYSSADGKNIAKHMARIERDTRTPMFIATVFIIATQRNVGSILEC